MCRINIIFRPYLILLFVSFSILYPFSLPILFLYLDFCFTWLIFHLFKFVLVQIYCKWPIDIIRSSILISLPVSFSILSHFLYLSYLPVSFSILSHCLYLSHFLSFPIVFTCLIFNPFPFSNTRWGGKSLMQDKKIQNGLFKT